MKTLSWFALVVGSAALVLSLVAVVGGNNQPQTDAQFGGFSRFPNSILTARSLSAGSTTPGTLGEILADGTGTTTLQLNTTSGKGTCLQMQAADSGAQVKAFITTTSWVIVAGTCK